MLKIISIDTAMGASYCNLFFMGSQKELYDQMKNSKYIQFLKKVTSGGKNTVFVDTSYIVGIEIGSYEQIQVDTKQDEDAAQYLLNSLIMGIPLNYEDSYEEEEEPEAEEEEKRKKYLKKKTTKKPE